jgi:hypothetical protein
MERLGKEKGKIMTRLNKDIDYKFHEDTTILKIIAYVDSTYDQHYAQDKIQATEFIFDAGHGEGFCVGNILKYAQRWGKKTDKTQKLDLYKVIHYTMILLGHIDREANAKLEKELDEYDMQMNIDKS